MAPSQKKQPSITPGPPSLDENLALALKDETVRRTVNVKLTIRGGIESQAYSFDFSAAGDGTAESRFECRPSGRKGESKKTSLAGKDFVALLGKVRRAMQLLQEQPSFLPDTVVGILEVSDGRNVRRFYFAADPEQAKTQGKTPPPELLGAVNAIYSLSARLTGSRSVKP
jgi:hypothetical protein